MSDTRICGAGNCDHPADDGYLCGASLRELEQYLAETPWLVAELENVLSKQTRFAVSGGKVTGKGGPARETKLEGVAVQPLILNPDASDALASVGSTMLLWQANLADTIGTPVRYPRPVQSAAWLMGNLRNIRLFVAAGDLYDEIAATHKHARNLIDRPSERRYLGDCGADNQDVICPEPLWGSDRENHVFCKACGTEWDQAVRLATIRETATTGLNDRIMTATEAAAVLVAYNLTDVDAARMTDRIRKWAEQPKDPTKKPRLVKKINLQLAGSRPRPGYKFGEILDILNDRKKAS